MMLASLRVRVTSWYGSLLAAALVIFGFAVWMGLRNYLLTTMQRTLKDESANIVDQFVAQVDAKGEPWLSAEMEESYAPESDGRYIRILREGQVLYQSRNVEAASMQSWPPASTSPRTSFFRKITARAGPLLLYTLPWESPAGVHFLIQEAAPTTAMD